MSVIDEKKLIDDLLHNDGMKFEVKIADYTPEALGNAFQEFITKMKEGFIDLIKSQPSFGWISVNERLPEYEEPVMGWDAEMRDMGIVNFIYGQFFDIIDMSKTNVTHWMPLPKPPKDGEH